MRPLGNSIVRESMTPASPTEINSSASFFDLKPRSTQMSVNLAAFSRSSCLMRCIGFLSDDPEHIAFAAGEAEALSDENLRIPAADRLDVGVALIIDVVDDDADLVDMARQHHRRVAVAIHLGETVAGDIAAHFCKLFCVLAPDFGGRGLEARRARGVEELLQEGEGFGRDHRVGEGTVNVKRSNIALDAATAAAPANDSCNVSQTNLMPKPISCHDS